MHERFWFFWGENVVLFRKHRKVFLMYWSHKIMLLLMLFETFVKDWNQLHFLETSCDAETILQVCQTSSCTRVWARFMAIQRWEVSGQLRSLQPWSLSGQHGLPWAASRRLKVSPLCRVVLLHINCPHFQQAPHLLLCSTILKFSVAARDVFNSFNES